MGQRHQIYVVQKDKEGYKALGAWHHQWCFGMRAVTSLSKLVTLLDRNVRGVLHNKDWCTYSINEVRLLDTAVKSTYGVDVGGIISRVHNETDEDYLISKDGTITPENGDNNDGCSLVVIDNVKQEIRACFFTPGHVEGQYFPEKGDHTFKAWSREKYLAFYYNKETQNKPQFVKEFTENFKLINETPFKVVSTRELKTLLKRKEARNIGWLESI